MNTQRILIIDDNRARAEGLMELLQLDGFIAHAAFNGIDGIARAKALQPDAILLDLHMPDMNGVEVIAVLRDDPSVQNIAIVLLTADRAPVVPHGSDAFLTYPVEMSTLKPVILGTIAKQRTQMPQQRQV